MKHDVTHGGRDGGNTYVCALTMKCSCVSQHSYMYKLRHILIMSCRGSSGFLKLEPKEVCVPSSKKNWINYLHVSSSDVP